MKLIVGLGNPGFLYAGSRHNVGFNVVKALARLKHVALKRERGIAALTAKVRVAREEVLLALPLTFMNVSGAAVKGLTARHKIARDDLLVVCDDLDLAFGRIKVKKVFWINKYLIFGSRKVTTI